MSLLVGLKLERLAVVASDGRETWVNVDGSCVTLREDCCKFLRAGPDIALAVTGPDGVAVDAVAGRFAKNAGAYWDQIPFDRAIAEVTDCIAAVVRDCVGDRFTALLIGVDREAGRPRMVKWHPSNAFAATEEIRDSCEVIAPSRAHMYSALCIEELARDDLGDVEARVSSALAKVFDLASRTEPSVNRRVFSRTFHV